MNVRGVAMLSTRPCFLPPCLASLAATATLRIVRQVRDVWINVRTDRLAADSTYKYELYHQGSRTRQGKPGQARTVERSARQCVNNQPRKVKEELRDNNPGQLTLRVA